MNIKAVVKVMNFHALLRVEASRNRAELLNTMQEELEAMMRIVFSNQNLKLDKSLKLPDPSLPVLRIYLGSDFGFCGSVNASVSAMLNKDNGMEQVAVGKKLRRTKEVSLFLTQEEYNADFERVRCYLERAVKERCWSGVELVYNHFYNFSAIKLVTRRIYPLEVKPEEVSNQWDDFAIEGNVQRLLEDMVISYLTYELKIAAASAYASENIMRQNATSESLKKLDELEQGELQAQRKERTQKAFQKTIDSFIKQKSLQGQ